MHLRFHIAPISATILLASANASAIPLAASPCNNGAGCGSNELCEIVGGSSAGCDPSTVCDPIVTYVYGCVPQPVACVATSECPFPLICVSDGDGSTGTGGSSASDPAPANIVAQPRMDPIAPAPVSKTCTYEPKTCTTAADCGDPRFDCMEIGRTEVCNGEVLPDSGGGSAGGATGSGTTTPGSGRAAAPPVGDVAIAPVDPQCEVQDIVRACFPKTVACKTAADCKDGWSCYNFSGLTEAPFYNAAGPNLYCMPPGLVLVLDGKVGVSGGDAFAEGGVVGGVPPRSTGTKDGVDESSGGPKAELSSGGGCSTAGTLANPGGLWTLLTLAGAMFFSRRARR
ncbi:MAG: hypothetical protein SGI86_06930 [Deltaproteobacteria bacterium]|nr:hypothetical protein [Deltaproteobacteria bacterium]